MAAFANGPFVLRNPALCIKGHPRQMFPLRFGWVIEEVTDLPRVWAVSAPAGPVWVPTVLKRKAWVHIWADGSPSIPFIPETLVVVCDDGVILAMKLRSTLDRGVQPGLYCRALVRRSRPRPYGIPFWRVRG